MSTVLSAEQRKVLDSTVQKARVAAENAAVDALRALAVDDTHRPAFLTDEQNELRLALRAKARQLGDDDSLRGADLTLLVRDVAYEQWHRLLFARFLERNGLLLDADAPDLPLSLEDCEELAPDEGEPDGWTYAAGLAAQILPGVFRLDDPAFRVRFSAEHRVRLEALLMDIPDDVFVAEDALGWVYQFWQTAEKKRVNDAGDKIGGADLSPVTQLFTENYMVRFLLENSLGAWWAARHPDSPLVADWDYLRRLDDGTPAAGTFPEWPERAAEVTVMDPCCGSGHFLVAMFGMLWRMRAEEEGLSDVEAQDAVLRDNLFGLELDPRCTQIATFNVALEVWKQGGYRPIPTPQVACSGVPVRQSREAWLDGVPEHLHDAMARLHTQFRDADTLGSLIDPRPAGNEAHDGAMFGRDLAIGVTWDQLRGYLAVKFAQEGAAGSVLGHATEDVVQAAKLLACCYTLVATNPPFLGLEKQSLALESYANARFDSAKRELALVMLSRSLEMLNIDGSFAMVLPSDWMHYRAGRKFRSHLLEKHTLRFLALLGNNSFHTPLRVNPVLAVGDARRPPDPWKVGTLVVSERSLVAKTHELKSVPIAEFRQLSWLSSLDSRVILTGDAEPEIATATLIGDFADARNGMSAGDGQRFEKYFWEIRRVSDRWELLQHSPDGGGYYTGRKRVVLWESETGEMAKLAESVKHLNHAAQNWRRGKPLWGRPGVAVSKIGANTAIYRGDRFDSGSFAIVPDNPNDLLALVTFALSGNLRNELAKISPGFALSSPQTLLQLPIDLARWRNEADRIFPDGLPEPISSDSCQWLFRGRPEESEQPLTVAAARLLGYRWPDQEPDELDRYADADGIVTLPNLGEGDAASRLRELLASAYGDRWSSSLEHTLVTEAGGKTGRLEDWLRDAFFAHHCKVFDNRPFLWHVWDGRKDGFSAILHYHRLDRRTLEKLTYTSLGTWITRQAQGVQAGTAGAEARLAAAQELKRKLELIIEGDAPYDVFVRWKPLHEQPMGWEPDLDDGVRLNIRPFVTAGILRSKVNVHWRKDRGKNPDGSDRINDLHPTLDERRKARQQHEAGGA